MRKMRSYKAAWQFMEHLSKILRWEQGRETNYKAGEFSKGQTMDFFRAHPKVYFYI